MPTSPMAPPAPSVQKKLRMLLAGVAVAALSVVSATPAAAQAPRAGVTVLQNEPGGYLAIYQYRFETLAANGDSVEIRGKCPLPTFTRYVGAQWVDGGRGGHLCATIDTPKGAVSF